MSSINVEQFARLYPQRAPQIMWFLGAGASASAGMPTAGQMVWDFKCQLYCAEQRVSLAACSSLTDPLVQNRIQLHFNDQGGNPRREANDEYAFYFERTFPDEMDRRAYIDRKVRAAVPSYGHLALAALLKIGMANIAWTTNFDRTIEDAVARIFGSTTALIVASLGEPKLARQALDGARWPLLGKLHGDFQSRRLKNTSEELQIQDAELRQGLLEACRRYGLAIAGYSGRDESVMETLREAIADGQGYPSGLFWFHRSGSTLSPQVKELIEEAEAHSIGAYFIEVETFDELLADVMRLIPNIPEDIGEQLDRRALRVSDAPWPTGSNSWPVIRLNALPVTAFPTICRRFGCDVGGTGEVRQALKSSGARVVAVRRKIGVLAFGSDNEVRKAFDRYKIRDWDVHAIETGRLRYDSQEQGLLYDALTQALERERPVVAIHSRHGHRIVIDQAQQNHMFLGVLKKSVNELAGVVPGTTLTWAEAAKVRLDHKLGRLWLLLEPTIWIQHSEDEELSLVGENFRRERLAKRYNSTWSKVLDGWVTLVVGDADETEIRAFGIGDGLDAAFTIGNVTGFSWRERHQ